MKKTVAVLSLSVFACLLMFQNCGKKMSAASIAGSNSGLGGTPLPTEPLPGLPGLPGATSFAKDEAFSYASVPNKSPMVQTQIEAMGYANFTSPKAIAINAQGLGFVSRRTDASQTVTDRLALEGCYALTSSPCALLASGDKFAISSADLPAAYTFTITAPLSVSETTIPFVIPGFRTALATAFNQAAAPKVLAISVDGAFSIVTGSDATPATTLDEARRVALERCELSAVVTPCTVFAENSAVPFNPANINRTPVIDYAKTQIMTSLPGVKDSHFASIVTPYLAAVNGVAARGVIYLAADGAGGFAYNTVAATAETAALNFCSANVSAGYSCFRYAIDKNVQSMAANLRALKSFPLPHCKSVPRATCAAHRAMGCGPGMYYTMNGMTPALENCL